jgi:hypothetical protein
VALITQQYLQNNLDHLVVRTERGNAVVQRNPRELPRRLRVLLLAVDGSHTVRLYVQTLRGFGDIGELMVELVGLGLVRLVHPDIDFASSTQAALREQAHADLHRLLDDSRVDPAEAAQVMYGTTAPGSFDEMLRVAGIEEPQFKPPPTPAPAPVSQATQKAQIESLFTMLDSVRGERQDLKKKLAKMDKLRTAARRLDKENQRLFGYVFALSTVCIALLVALLIMWVRR